jgi:hypothetical protein
MKQTGSGSTIGALTLGILAWAAASAAAGDCPHKAPREATVEAGGARVARVEAGAGALRVEGRAGATAVVVRGTACASRDGLLDDIQVRAERQGDIVQVKTDFPENSWFSGGSAWLDLVIEVPAGLAVEVVDGSGEAEIASVASVRVKDGSGELRIRDVTRDVHVRDGSGEVSIEGVGGSVTVDEDGSGGIEVSGVKGNVLVRNDGSGGISVRDVGGDFSVRNDGSGGIEHDGVRGRVSVPRR